MKPLFTALFFMSVIFFNTAQVDAATRLRYIMNELNANLIKVVDGVMNEDFDRIESASLAIAGHEKAPLSERKRIAGYLKNRASIFKKVDDTVHNGALVMAEASARHDMKAVLSNLVNIQRGCVECHSRFRTEVRKLFYK